MPDYRRAHIPGGTYFFTVNTFHREVVLTEDRIRLAMRRGIELARYSHPFVIEAWVLLPNHLHCIWKLPPGDADFSVRWAIIKRHVTKEVGASGRSTSRPGASREKRREGAVWQRRFWEHTVRDDADYRTHVDYIHWNPVKHGYVKQVRDWPYSTFHRFAAKGVYPEDWAGIDEGDIDDSRFGERQ